MPPEGAKLVFLNDPLSPMAAVLMAAAVAALATYGYSIIRVAGWKPGGILLLLRSAAVCALAFILLQPSILDYEKVEVELPESFTRKEVRVFSREELPSLLPPIAAFSPPEHAASLDLELVEAVAPPVAFFKARCTVNVTVVNEAPAQTGQVVVARLDREGLTEVARAPVSLREGRQSFPVTLVPGRLGRNAYSVYLEGFARDQHPDNNSRLFGLTVARDTVRVLHIAGHPSWDVRFLRQFLSRLPGVEVVSFYLLVEAQDFAPHSKEELALIPFPTDELFVQEIGNFDLIIVHNFPLGTYFLLTEKHLQRFVQFIEEGGGVLFIGGDKSFAISDLHKTPVAEIMPMEVLPPGGMAAYLDDHRRVELTAEGAAHPVTSIELADESASPEANLPTLSGVNRLGPTRPGGAVLATARAGEEDSVPLIIAGSRGRGRVLVVATDSLWRWAFPPRLSGGARAWYRGLLMNAVAWLTSDPRLDGLVVAASAATPTAGEQILATACHRGTTPEGARARIKAEWVDAAGKAPSLRIELEAPFGGLRCAAFSLPPAQPGAWSITAHLETENGEASGGGVVVVSQKRRTYTEELAERIQPLLGMHFYPFVVDRPFEVRLPLTTLEVHKPVLNALWDHPLFFFAFDLVLIAEWLLRKRWGYL